MRLASCPSLADRDGRPYLASDALDEAGRPCFGRGEVCQTVVRIPPISTIPLIWLSHCDKVVVSGTNLSARYFRQPGPTAAAFSTTAAGEAEFATGDIGCWRADGSLAIVRRPPNRGPLALGLLRQRAFPPHA